MVCRRFVATFLFLFLAIPSLYSQVQDTPARINVLRTDHLRLVYFPSHSYIVPHLARSFHNAFYFHSDLFDYQPSEDILLLLHSFNDYGAAGAATIPWNFITVCAEPFDYVYETRPSNERMNWLSIHELVHIVATDRPSRGDRLYRSLFFGKVAPTAENPVSMLYSYLTNPRWYSARWYHEGIAVFLETWMTGGRGRALGGYDEMVFRTMVRDNSYFYDFVGLESEGTTIDFQIGANSYLYGTRFISYLVYHYGHDKLIEWIKRDDDSKRYFASQFKNVYGISLDDEWSRWIEWEHSWQEDNLKRVRTHPVTEHRPVYDDILGSVSRPYYNPETGDMYVGMNYPGQIAHLASINISNGTKSSISDVTTPALYYVTHLAYDHDEGNLFYTTNNSRGWRGLNKVNIHTGESQRLLRDVRIGDIVFNPADKSIWGVQHHNGISRLVRIPHPYDNWRQILSLSYGRDFFDLDISPDGKYLTGAIVEIGGEQRLIKMEIDSLLQGDSSFEVLFKFEGNSPANFVFSPDGQYMFGTSYYSGISNVFRLNMETREMAALTNAETGYFRPLPVSEDSLIVFEYSDQGFSPVMIANEPVDNVSAIRFLGQAVIEKYPELENWSVGSPAIVDIDSLSNYRGEYKPAHHVGLSSVYPVVEGYKDYAAVGLRFNISDRLGLHSLDITSAYTPNSRLPEDERIHLSANYRRWPWRISASYNRSDFYDLFGPTKTSRKGYSLAVQYQNLIIDDRPKRLDYTVNVAGYGGLEVLPDFQNIEASFTEFLTASGRLNYVHVLRTLGAVEPEKGIRWNVNVHSNYVRDEFLPRIYANIDYGFLLPINHSSIWLRNSFGYSIGDRLEPFANFYFGGFGNNWVDHREVRRYREYQSFPGVEINAIGGTNYGKTMLEWTLPPIRFRRFGFPMMYCNWTQLTLFTSGIMTDIDNQSFRRELVNVGAQIDFQLVMFSMLESTLSFGYAAAFENGMSMSDEFMISLKILR